MYNKKPCPKRKIETQIYFKEKDKNLKSFHNLMLSE